MALGIFRIYDIFCGEVLMQDKGDGKISEFFDWFRIGFLQGIWIWFKFHLNGIWKFWTMDQKVFGEMECGYCHEVGVIFVDEKELGKVLYMQKLHF